MGASLNHTIGEQQLLLPNKDTRLTIQLDLDKVQELRVEMVRIQIGPSKGLLQFDLEVAEPLSSIGPWSAATPLAKLQEAELPSVSLEELVEIPLTRDLLERPLVKVQPPLACVTLRVEHEPPMLAHEMFPVKIVLNTNGDKVTSGKVTFTSLLGDTKTFDQQQQPLEEIKFDDAAAETCLEWTILLQASEGTAAGCTVQCDYTSELDFLQTVSLALDLELQKALETKFHFLPMGDASVSSTAAGGAITRLTQGKPVVMIVEVASKGVHPLQLLSVSPQLPWGTATPLTGIDESILMRQNDHYSSSWQLIPTQASAVAVSSVADCDGKIVLSYRRHTQQHGDVIDAELQLPVPAVVESALPLHVQLSPVPAQLSCGQPTELSVELSNRSTVPLKFRISLVTSEQFLVSGVNEFTVQLFPEQKHNQLYQIIAIKPGEVSLPRVQVEPLEGSEEAFAAAIQDGCSVSLSAHLDAVLGTKRIAFVHPSEHWFEQKL